MRRIAWLGLLALPALGCATTPATAGEPSSREGSGAEADPFAEEGSAAPRPGSTEHGDAIALLGIGPPDAPWASMTEPEREMYMVGRVLPIMQQLFTHQDEARFASMGCETCHGTEMRAVAFRMPPATAMPVPPPGSPGYARLARQFPETFRFMEETVTPTMGRLLGIEGTTCNHCHPASPPP